MKALLLVLSGDAEQARIWLRNNCADASIETLSAVLS
jgi:hypothetical protein